VAGTKRGSEAIAKKWYEQKSQLMEVTLGKEHDKVMHALIPFFLGGALDLYYYPNGLVGTAIATKELCELPDQGPSNKVYDRYELVMFTKQAINLDSAQNARTKFGRAHRKIQAVLNLMANYSEDATLNPNETCEVPEDFEVIGGTCMILDGYGSHGKTAAGTFGLLAVIEIFPSEMKFAQKRGGAALIAKLKAKGHYPFSDLDRKPVVA
jgi:Suppressor of fused protein (SUFU)